MDNEKNYQTQPLDQATQTGQQALETRGPLDDEYNTSFEHSVWDFGKGRKQTLPPKCSLFDYPQAPSQLDLLWQNFQKLTFYTCKQEALDGDVCQVHLLFHAKVYQFAKEKLMEDTQNCALQHIYNILLSLDFGTFPDSLDAFLQFLRFVYHEPGSQSSHGDDKLRSLTVHYTACKIKVLAAYQDFLDLLCCSGEIGSDLVRQLYVS
ncbi:MAG: hypothetical protein Q9159_001328 [Coniocarpon cinnabarinum]